MKIKFKKEKELLNVYNNDIHDLDNIINRFNKGEHLSPSLDKEHFEFIINKINIDFNNKVILDLGCGFSGVLAYICKNYKPKSLIGVEYSKPRIEQSKKFLDKINCDKINLFNYDINYVFSDLFLNDNFDIIMAFEVLEHLIDQVNIINTIKERLSENGIFIGTVPVQENPPDVHVSPFKNIREIKEKLKVDVFTQNEVPLRLPECRFIYYKKQ